MNKYLIVVALIIGAFIAGYLYKDEKIITVEKVVVKYYKAKQVTTKPDGTVVAIDVDSGSTENEWSKTEINKKDYMMLLYGGIGRNHRVAGVMLQKDFIGAVGLAGGLMYSQDRQVVAETQDIIGTVGVSVKW